MYFPPAFGTYLSHSYILHGREWRGNVYSVVATNFSVDAEESERQFHAKLLWLPRMTCESPFVVADAVECSVDTATT